MSLVIPLQPVPAQQIAVDLGNQPCTVTVYQKLSGLYMDLAVNDDPIVTGVICENKNRIVRSAYLGFTGDFIFVDSQGSSDPTFDGLGSRYTLTYLEISDLNGEA
jgi:hypothetical protein